MAVLTYLVARDVARARVPQGRFGWRLLVLCWVGWAVYALVAWVVGLL